MDYLYSGALYITLIHTQLYVIVPILQMWKSKLKQVKWLTCPRLCGTVIKEIIWAQSVWLQYPFTYHYITVLWPCTPQSLITFVFTITLNKIGYLVSHFNPNKQQNERLKKPKWSMLTARDRIEHKNSKKVDHVVLYIHP